MNQLAVPIEQLTGDPAWLPDRLDMTGARISFAHMSRQSIAREAFLDERKNESVTKNAIATLQSLEPFVEATTSAPAFIFHTAFCCSTLLARALDVPGKTLALKEPSILRDVSDAHRMIQSNAERAGVEQAYDIALSLISRPHHAEERTVIKPTNTANNLAPIVARSGARVLILYGDLKGFLVSVLKKGEVCKEFVRKQYNIFALENEGVGAIPERQALGFTDLQIAALVWRHQMELFANLLAAPAANNLRSLDFRRLLENPKATLAAVNAHLKLGLSEEEIAAVVNGPVFSTNAKFGDQAYDSESRARDEQALLSQHNEALTMIERWATRVKLAHDVPDTLPRSLMN